MVSTVDEYVDSLPEYVRPVMAGIRRSIRAVVPTLVHVAAWKKHVGLYPLPPMDEDLAREVAPYRGAKATMQLRYDRPIPYELVERVVAVLLRDRDAA